MKQKFDLTKQRGFTVIEVLIAVAIGGLILMVVFLAVPALQRSERNNSRKRTVAVIADQMEQYYIQSDFRYPDTPAQICDFMDNYLSDINPDQTTCDPIWDGSRDCIGVIGARYDICFHQRMTSPHSYLGPEDEISIQLGHNCNSDLTGDPITSTLADDDTDVKHYVIWTVLESGRLCVDNFHDTL